MVALAVTTTASYGVLYYAFPVLLGAIVADTGWTATQATAAFSASQLVAAACGVAVGRWIDRHGPRGVMTAGSVLAVVAVGLVATSGGYAEFFLAWLVVGLAMSAVFYPPAFTAITHWGGDRRVPALTAVTLVAGLASTVFAPLTAAMSDSLDWRQTYLVLAVILALTTVPLHALGLRKPWQAHVDAQPDELPAADPVRTRAFILLTLAFSLAAFAVYATLVNLVPLLRERGLSAGEAALALGVGGVGQVAGRLGYRRLVIGAGVVTRTVLVLAGVGATTVGIAVLRGPTWALIAVSAVVGMLRGLLTLLEATAVSDRWGTTGFGRLSGILYMPMTVASAVAPFGGAWIAAALGSQRNAFLVLGAVAMLAALLSVGTGPPR